VDAHGVCHPWPWRRTIEREGERRKRQ
jgi:hypothetical protein